MASEPGQLYGVDTLYAKRIGSIYPYYVISQDYFSKISDLEPIRRLTASSIKQALEKIIKRQPFSIHAIISDRGTDYRNAEVDEMLKRHNIRHVYSSPYSPSKVAFVHSRVVIVIKLNE